MVEEAHTHARPCFVSGPPGTGKTTVVDKCVRKCLREGGRVLYALPTAQQASRVRAKHPQAEVGHVLRRFLPLQGLRGGHGLPHVL